MKNKVHIGDKKTYLLLHVLFLESELGNEQFEEAVVVETETEKLKRIAKRLKDYRTRHNISQVIIFTNFSSHTNSLLFSAVVKMYICQLFHAFL